MNDNLLTTLRAHFGYSTFRPGQSEAIEHLLAGRQTLVVMPTGAGKSLIYQIAALELPGVTVVLSPLIALMKDQVDSLVRRGVPATFINSSLPTSERDERLRGLSTGAYRLAYVAPERLHNLAFQQALRQVRVSLLAVDEAHCISQWGHDFRPDYLQIAAARPSMGDPVTAALTATATPQVQDDIARLLGLPEMRRVVTGFNRPNLAFEVQYPINDAEKLRALRDMLLEAPEGAALIYVGTRADAEEVAGFVANVLSAPVRYYHAGMDAAEREEVQNAFLAGDLPIVVATNAFGMGIDRPDVRLVVHYAIPGTLEAYYQEAGRAGRDGEPARAILLYAPRDRALQEWFINNDAPSFAELKSLFGILRANGRSEVWTSVSELAAASGLPDIKVRVGLAQLQTAGSLDREGDEGARMGLRVGQWQDVALRQVSEAVEVRRQHRRTQLAKMVGYAETEGCRRRILLEHFGDKASAAAAICCDNCSAAPAAVTATAGKDVASLPQSARAALIVLDTIHRLKWGVGQAKLVRILRGSKSKEIQRFGYDRSPYYGKLAALRRPELNDLVGQLLRQRYVRFEGAEKPVLALSTRGQAALTARAEIEVVLPSLRAPGAAERIERERKRREAGGTVLLTGQMFDEGRSVAEIASERNLTEETIYNHLAKLIGAGSISVGKAVAPDVVAQVKAAIARVGGATYLAPLKSVLPDSVSYGEIRCVVEDWRREQGGAAPQPADDRAAHAVGASEQAGSPPGLSGPSGGSGGTERGPEDEDEGDDDRDEVTDYLAGAHPRPLAGPWEAGWALGFHSHYDGEDWQRSGVGELAYRLKYGGDRGALEPLVAQAVALCREHPEVAQVDAVVPIPSTVAREFDPVRAFAVALAERLGRPELGALAKARKTVPQKELRSLAQKQANVARSFMVREDIRGKSLLVVDDLYDSGATLTEAAHTLLRGGAARVCVLTMTRTIHADA